MFSLLSAESFGAGDFNDLNKLAKWAGSVGLKLIQLLPVHDTTATFTWKDSYPYAAVSVFALHPLYLHIQALAGDRYKNLLKKYEKERKRLNAFDKVDYEAVLSLKRKFIGEIYPRIKEETFSSKDYLDFVEDNEDWLKPYASFCCLRNWYGSADFSKWAEKEYDAALSETLMNTAKDEVLIHYFTQFHLHKQLKEAVDYAHSCKVVLKGDIPIGVYKHSADVWENKSLFHTDMQAGAPPDDFAVTGQNWGFPTYNWEKMKEDNYSWWVKRLSHTSQYFDAIRLDHILGFFRIWSIPVSATEGILGHFHPAYPVHKFELQTTGVHFPLERLYKPFIHYDILKKIFSDSFETVAATYFEAKEEGIFIFKKEYDTQRKIVDYFDKQEKNTFNTWIKKSLLELSSNVVLIPADEADETFHFRFNMIETTSFQYLNNFTKAGLYDLYNDYFYNRQNELWKQEALEKLPAVKNASNMLVCGEDLGFTPNSVPEVMNSLCMLRLFIQRMPKQLGAVYENLSEIPYLSVVSSSTHDTSSIRGWWHSLTWEEAQYYFNNILRQNGEAPATEDCPDWLNKIIIEQHLQSPAMWSILLLQDLLNTGAEYRCANPDDEQINHPENPDQYWNYRMPLTLEALAERKDFNTELRELIISKNR
ncbi:MAG: 4-alpha-glucanotransferase [Arachidicoccus sp.]|nr:4-alpha-glucanotransferase [Arachidicoccus sp.]